MKQCAVAVGVPALMITSSIVLADRDSYVSPDLATQVRTVQNEIRVKQVQDAIVTKHAQDTERWVAPSFEMFIDRLCTDEAINKKPFRSEMGKDAYKQHVWRQIVNGHTRHILLMDSKVAKDDLEEKIRQELASAIEYGKRNNFTL
jgi:hypothetical protein